jgi:hypothetical protein
MHADGRGMGACLGEGLDEGLEGGFVEDGDIFINHSNFFSIWNKCCCNHFFSMFDLGLEQFLLPLQRENF